MTLNVEAVTPWAMPAGLRCDPRTEPAAYIAGAGVALTNYLEARQQRCAATVVSQLEQRLLMAGRNLVVAIDALPKGARRRFNTSNLELLVDIADALGVTPQHLQAGSDPVQRRTPRPAAAYVFPSYA